MKNGRRHERGIYDGRDGSERFSEADDEGRLLGSVRRKGASAEDCVANREAKVWRQRSGAESRVQRERKSGGSVEMGPEAFLNSHAALIWRPHKDSTHWFVGSAMGATVPVVGSCHHKSGLQSIDSIMISGTH